MPPDLGALEQTLTANDDIAGVITEGSGASYGTVPLQPGFLEGVRRLTQQHGVVMILDEVITGFRWSTGGLQQKIGITPDLCTMAKILTGGMPGGAVAGRQDIMAVMEQTGDRDHDMYQRVSHGGTRAKTANRAMTFTSCSCIFFPATVFELSIVVVVV